MPRVQRAIRTSRTSRRSPTTATSGRSPEPQRACIPADDWGDIIPPYPYVDKNGEPQIFPGRNWSTDGQAIWENGCKPVRPPEPPGAGSITVVKNLSPTDDPGKFDLKIDGQDAASGVGHGGTGSIAVDAGEHVVRESGADGTSLDDYEVAIVCRNNKDDELSQGRAGHPSVSE